MTTESKCSECESRNITIFSRLGSIPSTEALPIDIDAGNGVWCEDCKALYIVGEDFETIRCNCEPANQYGECEICKKDDELLIDYHNHHGYRRGLVCRSCKLMTTSFNDDTELMKRTADFLEKKRK